MNVTIRNTSQLSGIITLPSSKSQSIRGIFIAFLSSGKSILTNILTSDDTDDAIQACNELGLKVSVTDGKHNLVGHGVPLLTKCVKINTGNSGISTHFMMPILGLRKNATKPIILDCGSQMRLRPIHPLVNALSNLGMSIQYMEKEGFLPIKISENLIGGITEVAGITSQYLSALLISLPCAKLNSEIRVRHLLERPYMEMTLTWLNESGIVYTHEHLNDVDFFRVQGNQTYKNFQRTITGDFSSASCLIAAAILTNGSLVLQGFDMQDPQGDKKLISILQKMGADIVVEPTRIFIYGGKPLKGLKIDASDIPDLLPILAVIGTYAAGKTEIINTPQARIKETDRIHSITNGITKLSGKIEEHESGLTIYQSKLHGNRIKGYGDHRTIMALSVAGLIANGDTVINNVEAVAKTFPNFFKVMQSIGANIQVHI